MTWVRRVAIGAALMMASSALAAGANKPEFGEFGLDLTSVDRSVAPGDDFYDHVNGGWLRTTQIPPDRAWWGENVRLVMQAWARVRDILEEDGRAPKDADSRKIGEFYRTYMDEAAIEQRGAAPLKPDLDMTAAVRTPADLARAMARLERKAPPLGFGELNPSFPVSPSVFLALKDTSRYEVGLEQGGLGVPDRDYVLNDDDGSKAVRTAYRTYAVKMFTLAGLDHPEARADRVLALERALAQAQWPRAEARDVAKTYNPMTAAQLAAVAPGFDWATYLGELHLGGQDHYRVYEPSALTGFARLAASEPMESWRDYLALRAIGNAAPFLSKAFVQADFDYFYTAVSGAPQMQPRWKRGVRYANFAMGDAIGRPYAARWFPASSKAAMQGMVAELKTAMAGRIDRLTWMQPQTKIRAKQKLANLRIEIGYPDHWRDYAALEIRPGDAPGNAQRAAAFEFDLQVSHLGRPVDRSEWWLTATPQTVNAFNAGPMVKLVFPAAYLAPPHYDPNADPAVNYGAIGAVIGHEISHSFDDQGAKLDETGRLSDWWTPADVAAFKAATDRLAAQFDAYEPKPGLHVNGRLTLGENTADLAGLAAALDAYHASLHGKPAPVLGGLTGDQRFFMSYAQNWRDLQRDEDLRFQLTSDPHSPGRYRTYTVRNLDAWYDAFGVTEGKLALPREQRVRIW